MKKMIAFMLPALALILMLTACGSNSKYADDAFINDLSTGLNKRWQKSDEMDKKKSDDLSSDDYVDLEKTELKYISKYSDKKFKNTKLQELAIGYINAVKAKKSMWALSDSNEFYDKYEETSNKRNSILMKINKIKKIKVNDAYKHDWDGVKGDGKVSLKADKQNEKLDNLVKGITFKAQPKEYADDEYTTYEAIVKNNTGYNIKSFVANIKLIDKDGTTADTQSVSTENWDNGDKVKFNFMTDAKVNKIEVHKDYVEFAK